MKLFLSLLIIFASQVTYAYKIAVYTDQADGTKANEVINTFKTTYPFNQFDIQFEVKVVAPNKLVCGPRQNIDRLIGCETQEIAMDASRNRIDQALIIKNSSVFGGSGGTIPVITTSTPNSTMIHEYLHTLGLCDEYKYAEREAVYYCAVGGPNLALINPDSSGYTSDQQARSRHMNQIPWNDLIFAQTKITTVPYLGTGTVNHDMYSSSNNSDRPNNIVSVIGLYRAHVCDNAIPIKYSWQPGREATIMEFLDAGLGGANEQIVAKILASRGVRRKLVAARPLPPSVNNSTHKDILIHNPVGEDDLNLSRTKEK